MSFADRTWVALLHHPVLERSGQIVTTAVTNLDIHDIARASRTYGVAGYLLVTPIQAQQELIRRILGHWSSDTGKGYNDKRSDALSVASVVSSLDDAIAHVTKETGTAPLLVATGARERAQVVEGYRSLRAAREADPRPVLLLFGTGWGLAEDVFSRVDAVLAPIRGAAGYNHLSVRSAVAIVLDRLFGTHE
jgi:hypothetical protein